MGAAVELEGREAGIGPGPKQGVRSAGQDGGWDRVGAREGVQPGPSGSGSPSPPPERFPQAAIKAPLVSAWSWSSSLSRRDQEGREGASGWGFFPEEASLPPAHHQACPLNKAPGLPESGFPSLVSAPSSLYISLSSCLRLISFSVSFK